MKVLIIGEYNFITSTLIKKLNKNGNLKIDVKHKFKEGQCYEIYPH